MAYTSMTSRTRITPKEVLKSVGPRLVPFLKTVALFFIIYPQLPRSSIWIVFLKCAPVISLMAFVLMHGMNFTEAYSYSRRILCGLILSCIGDAFLVFPNYFYYGLGAFALAHIFYAAAFGFRPPRWEVALVVLGIGIVLYSYLYQGLDGILVYLCAVYSAIIAFMLWRAIARVELFDDLWTWTKLCSCMGAVLFCISDTLLSFDRFLFPVPYGHSAIMITYYAAQVGITLSVVDSHVDNVILDSDLPKEDSE